MAIALSVLLNLPFVAAAAGPVPARGTWTEVTPVGVDLANMLSCENYGSITMAADPARPSGPQPGASGWTRMSTSLAMAVGPAQAATVFDGTNYIILAANWRAGLWRFVE